MTGLLILPGKAESQEVVSLKQLVDRALQNSQTVKSAIIDHTIAVEKINEVKQQFTKYNIDIIPRKMEIKELQEASRRYRESSDRRREYARRRNVNRKIGK